MVRSGCGFSMNFLTQLDSANDTSAESTFTLDITFWNQPHDREFAPSKGGFLLGIFGFEEAGGRKKEEKEGKKKRGGKKISSSFFLSWVANSQLYL